MSALRLEVLRLLSWRRWAVAAAVHGVVGIVVAEDLAGSARNNGFAANQWDVPLEALNNAIILVFILVPLFVGLFGDAAVGDRRTGFAVLSLVRIGSRRRWWAAKVGAVTVAAQLYYLLMWIVMTAAGLVVVGRGRGLSEYGQAVPDPFGTVAAALKAYGPPPVPSVPPLGLLVVAAYTAVATAAFCSVVLAASHLWPRAWVPLVLTLAIGLVFYGIPPTSIAHPLPHLFWDAHALHGWAYALTWWASGLYVAIEFTLAIWLGNAVLRRIDV